MNAYIIGETEDNMKDYFGYAGKNVVVTGGASGMGKAAAEILVDLGAEVYVLDWAETDVAGIAGYIHTDLSDRASIDAAFEKLPEKIGSFFGIAGISGAGTDFCKTVRIDAISNKYICEEYLLKRMEKGGSIAIMTSLGGLGWEMEDNQKWLKPVLEAEGWDAAVQAVESLPFAKMPGTFGYPYSKLAMNLYVAMMQKTFAAKGIRFNAVLPASTTSGLTGDFEKMAGGKDKLMANNGYGEDLARSEDMAKPIVFLNSDMASYVSGELMLVDFGGHIEEIAGIRPKVNDINLTKILAYMQQMAQQH